MSEDAVTENDVRHVASLARVALADDEVDRFTAQFEEILDAFETLEDAPSVDRSAELTNVLRPDEKRDSLSPADALENAPETEDGRFKGPNVS